MNAMIKLLKSQIIDEHKVLCALKGFKQEFGRKEDIKEVIRRIRVWKAIIKKLGG